MLSADDYIRLFAIIAATVHGEPGQRLIISKGLLNHMLQSSISLRLDIDAESDDVVIVTLANVNDPLPTFHFDELTVWRDGERYVRPIVPYSHKDQSILRTMGIKS